MTSLVQEIQAIADNADKCINYPIGDKLETFIRLQDEANERNFIVSGVLIYAAARIYGRKVDYLEQEIIGIRNNFEAVEKSTNDENQPEKEIKKSRSKKFNIKDRVNIEKQTFEEKPIQVLTKVDINKTLATPSKIDRLQKMKEFFSKNKSRGGKLVIPKSLLFTNENVTSNFGSTPIFEFDDNKDVVGSRRDFTSYSYFINSSTGELQSDATTKKNDTLETNIPNINENIPLPRVDSPEIWGTPPTSPLRLISTSRPPSPATQEPDDEFNEAHQELSNNLENALSINIDDGIEVDEATKAKMLLSPLTVKLMNIVRKSPNPFDQENITDAPSQMISNPEPNMKNIFMIPLKKLKHKCLFDLPNDEFGELKRRKRDQNKPIGPDLSQRQSRLFKPPCNQEMNDDSDDQPFYGFTKKMQEMPLTVLYLGTLNYNKPTNHLKALELSRKFSHDSGWLSGNDTTDPTNNSDLAEMNHSDDFTALESSIEPSIDMLDSTNTSSRDQTLNNSSMMASGSENRSVVGGDSCYHSCVSGDSSKTELSSFFKDIESRNNTIDESAEIMNATEPIEEESEERVLQMQQSAVNIAKWKEYLKPILAESEARSKIDMHQYGIQVVNKIGNVNDVKTFAEITEPGKTPAFFLSMLTLINNRNIEIDHGERSMNEAVKLENIQIKLKSKVLHQEKFDEMGQQFVLDEQKKVGQKRKAVQTSTPVKAAKRVSLGLGTSLNSSNLSQNMSHCSSGYFSQGSMLSDC